MEESIEKYKASRSKRWAAIADVLRQHRMTNMEDDDGEAYPLVDLMTNSGRTIADGEWQMIVLADEIDMALDRV